MHKTHTLFFICVALLGTTFPWLSEAEVIELVSVATPEQIEKSGKFCFKIKAPEADEPQPPNPMERMGLDSLVEHTFPKVGAQPGQNYCYHLSDFPVTELTDPSGLAAQAYKKLSEDEFKDIQAELDKYEKLTAYRLAFQEESREAPDSPIGFIMELWWEPKSNLEEVEPAEGYYGMVYVIGLYYPNDPAIEVNDYATKGMFLRAAEGAGEGLMDTNMFWLNQMLAPVILDYKLNARPSLTPPR